MELKLLQKLRILFMVQVIAFELNSFEVNSSFFIEQTAAGRLFLSTQMLLGYVCNSGQERVRKKGI